MALKSSTSFVLLLVIFASSLLQFPIEAAVVYKVGDSSGWTTIGNVDYKGWAAMKTFKLGDTIVFKYNPQFHNVMQVTHKEYQSCNVSKPIATYTTGNDSITIKNHGHHFFLCGVPGHCQSGQKVDINVIRAITSDAPAPDTSSVPPVATPGPSLSTAPPVSRNLVLAMSMSIAFAFASSFL